jgi:hypothetical protein
MNTASQEYNKAKAESITNGSISNAVHELTALHEHLIRKYKIDWYPTMDAPESYSELRRRYALMTAIPIAKYGCENSLYDVFGDGPEDNMKFRAVHDWIHITNNLDFSTKAEILVAEHHVAFAMKIGLSDLAIQLLEIDTVGQILYYDKHKEFVNNQSNFVMSQWNTMTVNGLWKGIFGNVTRENLISGKF